MLEAVPRQLPLPEKYHHDTLEAYLIPDPKVRYCRVYYPPLFIAGPNDPESVLLTAPRKLTTPRYLCCGYARVSFFIPPLSNLKNISKITLQMRRFNYGIVWFACHHRTAPCMHACTVRSNGRQTRRYHS